MRQVSRLIQQRHQKSIKLHVLKRRYPLLRKKFDQISAIISNATVEDERIEHLTHRVLDAAEGMEE